MLGNWYESDIADVPHDQHLVPGSSLACMTSLPPPPPQFPPVPPAPPIAPKRSHRTLFIVLGIVFAVCCLGGVGGGIALFTTVKGAIAPVNDAAKSYLNALRDGDVEGAYGQLCGRTRESLTLETFTDEAPKIQSYTITGTSVSDVNGVKTGIVEATLTPRDAIVARVTLTLVKEGGTWRVCGV